MAKSSINYEDEFTVEDETALSRLEERDRASEVSSGDIYKTGAYAGMMLPSAGIADYFGQYPNPEKAGAFLPSFDTNVNKGEYFDAAMQFLGAAGDASYTIPTIGTVTGTGLKALALGGKLSKVQLNKLLEGIGAFMTKTNDPMLAVSGSPNVNMGSSITKMDDASSGGGSKIPDDLNLGSGSLFSPEVKKGRKLLIVSCSADKCPDPGDMEAFDRYTGDMFKSIKKQGIPEENVDLAIMSAKYGLIRRDTKIPNYNVKMDKEIANNLLNDPTQVNRIKNTIEGYDEVVVEGSSLYKDVIKEAAGDAPITDYRLDYEKTLSKGERSNYGSGRQKQSVGKFIRSNTPQDVFHYTPDAELGFTVFDPDKATNALDALGTHVGTAKAASDRYEKTLGKGFALGSLAYDKSGVPIARTTRGGTYPLKADVSKPYTPDKFYEGQVSGIGPSKEVWGESDIYGHLLDEYNKNRGTRYTMRAMYGDEPDFPFSDFRKFIGEFRKKLAEDGFTHLPYYNEVEDYGSISYVMLTDRPKGSKAVLKGKFGKNDPRERTNPDIMKEEGGVVSMKDKAVNINRGPRGIEPFLQYMEEGGPAFSPEEERKLRLKAAYDELINEVIIDPRTGESRTRTEEEVLKILMQFQSPDFLQDIASAGFKLMPSTKGKGSVKTSTPFMGTLDGEPMYRDVRVNQLGGRIGFDVVAPSKDQFGAGVSVSASKGRVKNPRELLQFGLPSSQKFGSNKINVKGIDAYYRMMNALTEGDSVRAGANYNPNSKQTNYSINYNAPVRDMGIPALTQEAVNMFRRMVR